MSSRKVLLGVGMSWGRKVLSLFAAFLPWLMFFGTCHLFEALTFSRNTDLNAPLHEATGEVWKGVLGSGNDATPRRASCRAGVMWALACVALSAHSIIPLLRSPTTPTARVGPQQHVFQVLALATGSGPCNIDTTPFFLSPGIRIVTGPPAVFSPLALYPSNEKKKTTSMSGSAVSCQIKARWTTIDRTRAGVCFLRRNRRARRESSNHEQRPLVRQRRDW